LAIVDSPILGENMTIGWDVCGLNPMTVGQKGKRKNKVGTKMEAKMENKMENEKHPKQVKKQDNRSCQYQRQPNKTATNKCPYLRPNNH